MFDLIDTAITGEQFLLALHDTLIMVAISLGFGALIGVPLGIVLVVCRPGGIVANPVVHQALNPLINVLRSLGFNVLVCDPVREASEGGDYVSLEQIIEQCDVLSLHTPLDASTRHLIGAEQLRALRPGAWLINASRGAVAARPVIGAFRKFNELALFSRPG